MKLTEASINILKELRDVIVQLTDLDFKTPIEVLGNSTIGQHTRHTLEFFVCLEKSLESGIINYDQRDHDKLIESDKVLSLSVIDQLISFLSSCKENKTLKLASNYDVLSNEVNIVESNLHRELVYNIEHAIHHMAIIKIGIRAIATYVKLPEHFGVAISTIKYQNNLISKNS